MSAASAKGGGDRPAAGLVTSGLTRAAARRAVAAVLMEAGIGMPDLDARRLVSFACGIDDDVQWIVAQNERLTEDQARRLTAACARRLSREPISRIIGVRAFHGHRLVIGPHVLDPRPETETLVDVVLEAVASRSEPLRIADIGTGSGAIIISLMKGLPGSEGVATDISAEALAVARRNAAALGVADRIAFVETDLLSNASGQFDVIVSNPPYIRSNDLATLEPEVIDHDPRIALDGGDDGLMVYREISKYINKLNVGGLLALEVGAGQADEVAGIFEQAGMRRRSIHKDLGGHARVVTMLRNS